MNEDAKNNGSLTVYNEFSWCYPWYRVHVKISISGAVIDVGFSPILPFGDSVQIEHLEMLLPPIPVNGTDPELAKQIAEETIIGTLVEGLGLATALIASANTHITLVSALALGFYSFGITTMLLYAYSLHTSGDNLKALSVLTGVSINMLGVGLAAFLGMASLTTASHIADWIALPILGAVLTNMIDPSSLVVALTSAVLMLFVSIAIGVIIYRAVPDPISSWFLPAFICMNFAFAIFAHGL